MLTFSDPRFFLSSSFASCLTAAPTADSEHHVRPHLRPERARGGHGEADRGLGDEARDAAEQPAGSAGSHQPADQPAAPRLPGGAAAAVRALAVRVPPPLVLHCAPHLLREQLEARARPAKSHPTVKPYGFSIALSTNSDARIRSGGIMRPKWRNTFLTFFFFFYLKKTLAFLC